MSVGTLPLDDNLVEALYEASILPGEVADYFEHSGVHATAQVDRTDRVVAIDYAYPFEDESFVDAILDRLYTVIMKFYRPAWGLL